MQIKYLFKVSLQVEAAEQLFVLGHHVFVEDYVEVVAQLLAHLRSADPTLAFQSGSSIWFISRSNRSIASLISSSHSRVENCVIRAYLVVPEDRSDAVFAADVSGNQLEFSLELADLVDEIRGLAEAQQQLLRLFVALDFSLAPVRGIDGPVLDSVVQEAQVLGELGLRCGSTGCPAS